MKRTQQGFTLIELMIVVAIVGILAAIAIPAYQDYIARSKVSEGLASLAEAKTTVAEYYSTNGTLAASAVSIGIDTGRTTPYTSGMTWSNAAQPVVGVFLTNINTAVNGTSVQLTGTRDSARKDLEWSCSNSGAIADQKYYPSNCRN